MVLHAASGICLEVYQLVSLPLSQNTVLKIVFYFLNKYIIINIYRNITFYKMLALATNQPNKCFMLNRHYSKVFMCTNYSTNEEFYLQHSNIMLFLLLAYM